MIIVNIFIRLINSVFSLVGTILNVILMAFPVSPFHLDVPQQVTDIIAKANYFLPINEMVVIGETWLVAIGIYYLYSVYARWAKAIQ